MADEGMELIQKRVQQAVAMIERLKEEKQNLKDEIARMQDEIQKLKEEAYELKKEREAIKDKIDTAVSMLDKVDLEEEETAEDIEGEEDSTEE